MKAERLIRTVEADGHVHLNLPKFCNQQIEVIILPIVSTPETTTSMLNQQSQSGFAQTVLADSAEDVWNEL